MKLYILIILVFIQFIISGCSSHINDNDEISYPYKILKTIPSPFDKNIQIKIIKVGVKGGATVSFAYQFFISKNSEKLYRRNMFLWVNMLENYDIKWMSFDTINVKIKASRVLEFKTLPYIKDDNDNMSFYKIVKFIYSQ